MSLREKIKKLSQRWLHIEIDRLPPEGLNELPNRLISFIWFFLRQVKIPVLSIAAAESVFAILISVMFWYVGALVEQAEYALAMLWVGLALLLIRIVTGTLCEALYHLIYTPYVGNLIRRQLYWYTAKQSLSYFQNDFSGRIANKLIQSAPALRDAIKSSIGSVLFALTFTISNLYFMLQAHWLLALPLVVWLIGYILALCYFVPKVKHRSRLHSEDMSTLTGQIVDSLTNFLLTKYFAQTIYEDRRVVALLKQHSKSFRDATSTIFKMTVVIDVLNTLLLLSIAMAGFWMINEYGQIGIAAMAMALPMALQATFQSGWIMFEISGIFENLGAVQEAIDTLSKPHDVTDREDADILELKDKETTIIFKNVTFHYGHDVKRVINDLDLYIPAGQKVGLVGHSGAGKSTITSLLVRAYDIESGSITINNQNIAHVTQDSLRRHITVVTQESYLFHRSVLDNICYGHPDATLEEAIEAAKKASAHDFIQTLEDNKGRCGYSAHVGERGVQLSGGQRQRIGIARAILKDAPILILDEATSALDSESEHAIQNALASIMEGKTVIAIAHRFSTLRQMDRILVMENGCIVEDGTHDELLSVSNGHYARLWAMQSGGFINTLTQ